jgi:glycosyltransferase involved in cell wall biosynthesis
MVGMITKLSGVPRKEGGPESLPSVTTVVTTHNRRDTVVKLVETLLPDQAATEILVVVDGSSDGTAEALTDKAKADPRLRIVETEGRGEAGARQAGAEAATSDVLLFLDDDVMPTPGLIAGHAQHHRDRQNLLVLGYMPVTLPARRRGRDLGAYLYADAYENRCAEYERDPASVITTLWGGNFSLRSADARRVGLESSGFEGYAVDRDFGLRCARAGMTGIFDRSLLGHHLYDRPLEDMLASTRSQGRGRRTVHERHEDIIGPLEPQLFDGGLPAPAAAVVRAARRPRMYWAIVSVLLGLAGAAGSVRAFSLQTAIGRLLRRIEYQRGAAERN